MGTGLAAPHGALRAEFQDILKDFDGNHLAKAGPFGKARGGTGLGRFLPHARRPAAAPRPTLRAFSEAPEPGIWLESAIGADARVLTPGGAVPAGQLCPGDLVETKDHGAQPLLWVGLTRLSREQLAERPALCPVRIRASAIDGSYPRRDIAISPSAGLVMRSRHDSADERLVTAAALTRRGGFCKAIPRHGITYVQLLFEAHEVIVVEGLELESFHPGNLRPTREEAALWSEIMEVLPGLEHEMEIYGPRARPGLSDRARL